MYCRLSKTVSRTLADILNLFQGQYALDIQPGGTIPAVIWASDVRGRLFKSLNDFSAAALRSGFFLLDSWTRVESSAVSNCAVMLDMYTFGPAETHIPPILVTNDQRLNANEHSLVTSAWLSYSTDIGHVAWQHAGTK